MEISIRQTKMMLDEYDADQFKSLNYLIGECNYGGAPYTRNPEP